MPGRTDGAPRSVAYLGPAGTFSEEALLGSARPGSVEPVAVASIREAVDALEAGSVELAIVPIENSLEGSINVTLDLLAEQAGEVRIVGETLLRVRHCLIAAREVPLEGIESVVSHPQVPGQCTRFLRAELAQAQIRAAASTAEAVRGVVAAGDDAVAALGTELAAEIYGAVVLRAGVEDRAGRRERGRAAAAAGRRRAAKLARLLGRRRPPRRLARALPRRVRRARDQPSQDRVAPAAGAARRLHVLRRARGRREGGARRGGPR